MVILKILSHGDQPLASPFTPEALVLGMIEALDRQQDAISLLG